MIKQYNYPIMKNNYNVEYDILLSKVHRWGELIRFGGTLLIDDIEEDVQNSLYLIQNQRDQFVSKVFSKKNLDDIKKYEIEAVNICILSLIVGVDLNLPHGDLIDLGVAALLKDLGMNRVPKEILNKSGQLSEDEIAEIRKHPIYSSQILEDLGFTKKIIDIVLDHHERWDGKGYPRGKSQDEINYLSRILSVLDGYISMREDRPYRESLHGYDAIKSIIGDNGQRYDPSILNIAVKSIGIYPIGSYVALNDASICQVVAINKSTPLKPIVKVIVNKNGTESKSNQLIDISDNNSFFIVKSVLES